MANNNNNNNTDLTEEDAADLQFPKVHSADNLGLKRKLFSLCVNSECSSCNNELTTPYIICVVCDVNICISCFANGSEFSNHKNNHNYSIFNNNFILFEDSNWTAKEELTLLSLLLEYGNFDMISRELSHRSVKEIKDHYDTFYLERRGSNLLPCFPEEQTNIKHTPIVPYRFRLNNIEEPPRYNSNSFNYHLMAGYNAARSDFELEYDSNAEDLISNLNFKSIDPSGSDFDLITNLQCAIINSYNRRLRERQRRKSIISRHGLILNRKTVGWLHRYNMTVTRPVYERMCRFMQFYTGMQFEFVMEGLHRAGEIKLEISRLCDFRNKGITTFSGAHLYLRLKKGHEDSMSDVKAFQNNAQFSWRPKSTITSSLLINAKKRCVFSPLDIIGLPGYEKLTLKEQSLCTGVRLVPLSYLEFKEILINENRKLGYLKLQAARRLLKIDVNKTRRLYDFLVNEGYINKQ